MPYYAVRINQGCMVHDHLFKSKRNAKIYLVKRANEYGKEFNKRYDSYKKFNLPDDRYLELCKYNFEDESEDSDDTEDID